MSRSSTSDLPARLHALADEVAVALAAGTPTPAPDEPGPAPAAPAKPTGLVVTIGADGRPDLRWDAAGDADEWDVRDELNTAKPVQATVTEPRSLRSPLKPGQRRSYTIVARNSAGESTPSDPVAVPPAGDAPGSGQPGDPGAPSAQLLPTDVLPVLKTWTITTTTGKPGSPDNLYPAKIGDGKGHIPGVFYVTDDGGVMFHATVNGVTTPNSKRCRVEARQMADDRWTKAAWNSAQPHTLEAELWVSTAGMQKRKRVSALQIHTGADDLLQVLGDAEYGLIVLTDDGKTMTVLDPDYRDRQRFTCRIETGPGKVRVTYNGTKTVELDAESTSSYWKVGAYNQGSMQEHGEPASAFGEVVIYRLEASGKLTTA